jgi:hypothetical protein
MDVMAGFPAFACCFALLVWIWHEHNAFFRRYGLQDNLTVLINAALLFVMLFYVYPLKFMFDSMFVLFIRRAHPPEPMSLFQLANASVVYAIGFILMMLMFVLLYARAYSRRRELQLSELDVFDLMADTGHMMVSMVVGFVALSVAAFAPLTWAPLSPTSLSLMGPGHFFWGRWHGRRRAAMKARVSASASLT